MDLPLNCARLTAWPACLMMQNEDTEAKVYQICYRIWETESQRPGWNSSHLVRMLWCDFHTESPFMMLWCFP